MLEKIFSLLQDVKQLLLATADKLKLMSQQITAQALSDISKNLGLLQSGEFRSGNGLEPGRGFTGVRLGYPPFTYGGKTWHLVGINNDTLQAGMSATDGTIVAGAGEVIMSDDGLLLGDATDYLTGIGCFFGLSSGVYKFHIGNPAGNYLSWNGTNLTANGQWIASPAMNPALQSWNSNVVFTSTDADTISWAAGTVALADGTTYSIQAGNTGNMTVLTYLYVDVVSAPTVLTITTTYTTAIGDGKILVAVAQKNTTGASIIVLDGHQIIMDGSQLVAASIVAGQLAANSVVAANISVSNLQAISANMGALTVDNKLTMSGASSAIAVGTTPPTSASAGTGVWLDRTGLYGLNANVVQASIDATDGKIKAGAEAVTLDENGIQIEADATYTDLNSYKLVDSSGNYVARLVASIDTVNHVHNGQLQVIGNGTEMEADLFLSAAAGGGSGHNANINLAANNVSSLLTLTAETVSLVPNGGDIVVGGSTTTLNSAGVVYSDTYTPTLYNTTNVAASTPQVTHYARIGNFVMVSGVVAIDTTTTGTSVLGMSLPIASAFSSAIQLGGTGALNTNEVARLRADVTNDRVLWEWTAVATANVSWAFSFGYLIV
jgi:hypothetical protein